MTLAQRNPHTDVVTARTIVQRFTAAERIFVQRIQDTRSPTATAEQDWADTLASRRAVLKAQYDQLAQGNNVRRTRRARLNRRRFFKSPNRHENGGASRLVNRLVPSQSVLERDRYAYHSFPRGPAAMLHRHYGPLV